MSEKRGAAADMIAGEEMHTHVLIRTSPKTGAPIAKPARAEETRAAPARPQRGAGSELADHQTWTYGYPPVSGRFFGSGN